MECRNLRPISGSLLIDRRSARREIGLDFPEDGLVIRVAPGEGEGPDGTARGVSPRHESSAVACPGLRGGCASRVTLRCA
jgi:hypothetical protein